MLQKQHALTCMPMCVYSPKGRFITLRVIHMCVTTRLRMITPHLCGSPAWDDTGSSSSLWADHVRLHMRAPCDWFCGFGKSKSILWVCYSCVPPKGLHRHLNMSLRTVRSKPVARFNRWTHDLLISCRMYIRSGTSMCLYKLPICKCVIAAPYSCVKGF